MGGCWPGNQSYSSLLTGQLGALSQWQGCYSAKYKSMNCKIDFEGKKKKSRSQGPKHSRAHVYIAATLLKCLHKQRSCLLNVQLSKADFSWRTIVVSDFWILGFLHSKIFKRRWGLRYQRRKHTWHVLLYRKAETECCMLQPTCPGGGLLVRLTRTLICRPEERSVWLSTGESPELFFLARRAPEGFPE